MRAKKLKDENSSISVQLQALTQRLATLPQDIPADEIYKAIKQLYQKRDQIKMEMEKNQNEVLGQDRPVDDSGYLEYLRGLKNSWMTVSDNLEAKEKMIKSLIAKIELGVNEVSIGYWMGKERFNQVPENSLNSKKSSKNLGSSTLHNGGSPETRTRTPLRAVDFESTTSTIPSGSHWVRIMGDCGESSQRKRMSSSVSLIPKRIKSSPKCCLRWRLSIKQENFK